VAVDFKYVGAPRPLFELGNQGILHIGDRSADGAVIECRVVVCLAAEAGDLTRLRARIAAAARGEENVSCFHINQAYFHLGMGFSCRTHWRSRFGTGIRFPRGTRSLFPGDIRRVGLMRLNPSDPPF
jgi:hypothetical protein